MNKIDLESLLAEITPEAPSGDKDLKDDPAFIDLEITIAGTPEREFDGKIVQEAKDPNWGDIQDAAVSLLARSHDLRVAMFLTQALLHTDGFNGFTAGLTLLHGLMDRYWESLYPRLDPEDNNDPIQRINILAALSEGENILGPLKKSRLCMPRRLMPCTFRDILIANGKIDLSPDCKTSPPKMVDIEAAFKDTDVNDLLEIQSSIHTTLDHLNALKAGMNERIDASHSGSALDFKELHEVLMEMDANMEKQLEGRKLPQSSDPSQTSPGHADENTPPAVSAASPAKRSMDAINDRQDVIHLLDKICRYYQHNEPGSPIPLLLKRARQLVEKDFIEIIQDLAPDSAGTIQNLISGADKSGS